jgi:hypothetical protein
MTELNMLYGGNEDNLLSDNYENAYSNKMSKASANESMLYGEEKPSKPQYNPNILAANVGGTGSVGSAGVGGGIGGIGGAGSSGNIVSNSQIQQMPSVAQIQNSNSSQQFNYDLPVKNYNLYDNSQYNTHVNDNYRKRVPEYNFFDRMNMKKSEVIKLALFSLVIVLGISVERLITYYLSKYIGDNILTEFQEFLLRFSYPIGIFLVLWIFKAI